MKQGLLLVLSFLIFASGFSCRTNSVSKNEFQTKSVMKIPQDSIGFSEVRRVNRDIIMNDYMIITKFTETVELYSRLDDKKFSRSEPIPALFENDFLLILKPKMIKQQFGDIEVTKMAMKNYVLNVYYKEISNEEYLSNKQKNPILILRINGAVPSSVKMITVNE